MKSILYLTVIAVLFSIFLFGSCSKSKGSDKINPNEKEPGTSEPSKTTDLKPPDMTELVKSITPEALKDAHSLIPAYPNATLDPDKGSYSRTAKGDVYNIVYHTPDSLDKIAEFFRANIAPEYLQEMKSAEDDPKKWIHFQFGGKGFNQKGAIYIREVDKETVEIVYLIQRPSPVIPE